MGTKGRETTAIDGLVYMYHRVSPVSLHPPAARVQVVASQCSSAGKMSVIHDIFLNNEGDHIASAENTIKWVIGSITFECFSFFIWSVFVVSSMCVHAGGDIALA